ncbi:DUF6924 domain-containing protein [Streptomyces sp. NBC_00582]|uniref:DUF6924 domain-containing protein n=1 Tax=Streptomyces sp. NBC_00582 TaxID=2975783 RepID=UPI001062CD3D|nr:hypothetical protein [Streptomyces sp. NBC_00582]WUB64123.1 hypothetical protein OG852_28870 [Streptomyces sp. NBC_00582]
MALPRPDDLTSLVLRTDFSDDAAWDALRAVFDGADGGPHATWVSDPRYDGAGIPALLEEDGAADEEEQLTHVFLADAKALADGPERFLLAVDLYDEPGRTVRVPPAWFPDLSANLSIANLDFADFADCADATGTFRGWDG